MDQEERLIKRVESLENRSRTADPRIDGIQQNIVKLQQQLTFVAQQSKLTSRMALIHWSLDELNASQTSDDELRKLYNSVQDQILNPPHPPFGRIMSISQFQEVAFTVERIAKLCYPEHKPLNLLEEPAAPQMDQKVEGEPADLDEAHKYRRIYWQYVKIRQATRELRSNLTNEMTSLSDALASIGTGR